VQDQLEGKAVEWLEHVTDKQTPRSYQPLSLWKFDTANGRTYKWLIRCGLGAGSVHWTISATGSSVRPRERHTTAVANPLRQFLERIEDLEPGPFEVPVIPGGDRESVATRRRCDVAVFDWHTLAGLVEKALLLCPDMGH
jgi:hypothetical protein